MNLPLLDWIGPSKSAPYPAIPTSSFACKRFTLTSLVFMSNNEEDLLPNLAGNAPA